MKKEEILKQSNAKQKLKKEKLSEKEQQIFINGVQAGIQICLKNISGLDRNLAIQVEMQKTKTKK